MARNKKRYQALQSYPWSIKATMVLSIFKFYDSNLFFIQRGFMERAVRARLLADQRDQADEVLDQVLRPGL